MKMILLFLLCINIFIPYVNASVSSAYEYVLMDMDSGRVLTSKNKDSPRLIASITKVIDEEIVLQFPPKDGIRYMVLPKKIDLLMTQNPYTSYSILDWDTLHNSGNYDIAIGIYGNVYDKDIKEKLNMLKSIKEKILFGDYKYSCNTDNDTYYAALVSDRKIKIKK